MVKVNPPHKNTNIRLSRERRTPEQIVTLLISCKRLKCTGPLVRKKSGLASILSTLGMQWMQPTNLNRNFFKYKFEKCSHNLHL